MWGLKGRVPMKVELEERQKGTFLVWAPHEEFLGTIRKIRGESGLEWEYVDAKENYADSEKTREGAIKKLLDIAGW